MRNTSLAEQPSFRSDGFEFSATLSRSSRGGIVGREGESGDRLSAFTDARKWFPSLSPDTGGAAESRDAPSDAGRI